MLRVSFVAHTNGQWTCQTADIDGQKRTYHCATARLLLDVVSHGLELFNTPTDAARETARLCVLTAETLDRSVIDAHRQAQRITAREARRLMMEPRLRPVTYVEV